LIEIVDVTEPSEKFRLVAEERIRPIVIDELPPGRTGRAIVQEDDARFASPQQIERKLQRTKFLWTVDQNGVARLNESRQDFARVAEETFNVAMWREPLKCNCAVRRGRVQLDADDPHIGKTVRQRERTATERPARFKNLPRLDRADDAVKQEHFTQKNSTTALLLRDGFDCGLKIRQEPIRNGENSIDTDRLIRVSQREKFTAASLSEMIGDPSLRSG
jgi:hypothetical protein